MHLKLTFCPTELEKLPNARVALQIARELLSPRDPPKAPKEKPACILPCETIHSGTYCDRCIEDRCLKNRIYWVGTNDGPFAKTLRKIPGVPILILTKKGVKVDRLPDPANI